MASAFFPLSSVLDRQVSKLTSDRSILPPHSVFMAANKLAMLYDPNTNTERRLKSFPNGVTVSCWPSNLFFLVSHTRSLQLY
jgi:hypothetical protein